MLVLDTDHLSLLERGEGLLADRLRLRLDASPLPKATTIVTYEEQCRGWLAYVARAQSHVDQIDAYFKLWRHLETYRKPAVTVLQYEAVAAAEYQRFRKSKISVGPMDLKIAAIVLAHDATLLSRNLKDFEQVPGLKVENWLD